MKPYALRFGLVLFALISISCQRQHSISLLSRYPSTLPGSVLSPQEAQEWTFTRDDIYALSRFELNAGSDLKILTGPAELGIGHSQDGAVWAVVIPKGPGTVESSADPQPEEIESIWLRFHPSLVETLFPPQTVKGSGNPEVMSLIQRIQRTKLRNSYHAGDRVMIPEPKDLVVDLDTRNGVRRFFNVDRAAPSVKYVEAFVNQAMPPERMIVGSQAEQSFDQLWTAYDKEYAMFVLRPEVDWNKLRDEYRPKAAAAKTAREFAEVCAQMLAHLRDLHIWLRVGEEGIPVYNRPRETNANPQAFEAIIGPIETEDRLVWGKTQDKVGFIAIHNWPDQNMADRVDEALEEMRDTRGLVVDVRLNGGGDEPTAQKVAGRFVKEKVVYSYSQYRNGPKHEDLTAKYPRAVEPRYDLWRYDRPVILLIGQRCLSSNESFVCMMAEAPNVTTMGDRTGGSSGNPRVVELPIGVTASLPRWLDLIADGTPLDVKGVQPDVPFTPQPGAFEGKRDDLLLAAVERLRQEPLPAEPIADVTTGVVSETSTARLRIVSFEPALGAKDVPMDATLAVQFNQPMDPNSFSLTWETGGFYECRAVEYQPETYRFVYHLLLQPGVEHQVSVNTNEFYEAENPQILRRSPLRPQVLTFSTAATPVVKSASAPQVAAMEPPLGSQAARMTRVKITFDQPMRRSLIRVEQPPSAGSYGSRVGIYYPVRYDEAARQFTVPLVLPPNWRGTAQLVGFESETGVPAPPVELRYVTGGDFLSAEMMAASRELASSSETLRILQDVRQKRGELLSISETVQTLSYAKNSPQSYSELTSQSAYFQMQGESQFFGDVSKIMDCKFMVGSNGNLCWFYYQDLQLQEYVQVPFQDVQEKNLILGDTLAYQSQVPALPPGFEMMDTAEEVEYAGRPAYMLRAWQDEFPAPSYLKLWIDRETGLPIQIVNDRGGVRVDAKIFTYQNIDGPLPAEAFLPSASEATVAPRPTDPLEPGFRARFLNVMDGSRGDMSVRWGVFGERGRDSSGLN